MRQSCLVAMLATLLALAGCAGFGTKTATLHSFDGNEWLLIRESEIADSSNPTDISFKTRDRVAIRQTDGTFRVVAETSSDPATSSDDFGGRTYIDRQTQKRFMIGHERSIFEVIGTLTDKGAVVSDVDVSKIMESGKRRLIVPEEAFKKPKAKRVEDGGMY